ncbi:MAG TPA: TetR family transcriptional regulator [Acetobacteraceae bacterium]|nr:TetR family transcriptional regulator [Acetobacteraceae bacterium]
MDDAEFDRALVGAAFALAAERGWREVTVAEAARRADLPLDRARARFPMRAAILMRFGRLADQAALGLAPRDGPHRDRLFDLLMRRFDVLQAHRAGVLALLRALPGDPCLTAFLGLATTRSMGWMLDAAGIATTGLRGRLRTKGLVGVWLATLHAWRDDASEDLSATMAALDRALKQAERVDGWLTGRRHAPPEPHAHPPPAGAADEPTAPPL